MKENQNGPKSVGICEKILGSFTVFTVFRKTRRMSSRQQVPKSVSPAPNPKTVETQTKLPVPEQPKSLQGFKRLESIEVPIEFDYSSLHSASVRSKPATTPHFPIQNTSTTPDFISLQEKPKLEMQNNGQGDKAASEDHKEKQKPKLESPEKALSGEGQPALDINDMSSDYIKRAKMKIIRTGSDIEGGKNATGLDDDPQDTKKRENTKDLFSEFINRAKVRIRTTPSMKSGRIISFKRD